jgi:hypothetical protein
MGSLTLPKVKTGKASLRLTSRDLFDRIINLKFIRASKRTFTVRSDCECVFYKNGGQGATGFKKCVQKPDIKITYKQVSPSVAIEIGIEIKNLHIEGAEESGFTEGTDSEGAIAASGGKSDISLGGDPVETCVIQMGYRAQFPDWVRGGLKKNIDQFYDLNNNAITALAGDTDIKPPAQLTVQILAGYPTSYPPDRTIYFQGTVGGLDTGLRWNHTVDELVTGFGDAAYPDGLSEIEDYLNQFVRRRFVCAGITHRAGTAKKKTKTDGKDAYAYRQEIEIYNDGSLAEGKAVSGTAEPKWEALPLGENGLMSVGDAKKYGVACYCSKVLRNKPANGLYGYGLTVTEAEALRPIPPVPYNDLQDTLAAQLNSLQQHFPFLRWFALDDGNYFFYHENETDADLWTDPFIKERQKEKAVILPAVYDITPSGVRTIRAPFVSWVGPAITVLFSSRFSKGTFTSYFYPAKTKAFLVMTASVKFATVEDVNEMELACVDIPEKDAPAIDPATGEITVKTGPASGETPELSRRQKERDLQWTEKTLDVVEHKTGAANTDSRWANIVEKELKPSFRPENWPEGQAFTEALALNALKDWNPDYFDPDKPYMKRSDAVYGRSIENDATGIGGRTGIEVCWLKAGEDRVVVRYPFQAEYPDDGKAVV